MGKNIKSYATTQVHFPREREGSLTAKTSKCPNLSAKIWLNRTHWFLNLQAKFFNYVLYFAKFPANQAKFAQFTHILRE